MKIKHNYNKEDNIFSVNWENDYEVSEEFTTNKGIDFVIDLNKKGEIIGIEILEFKKK